MWRRFVSLLALALAPIMLANSASQASDFQSRLLVPKVPGTVADVTFKNGQGDQLTLADFRGKLVVLNVWATWCPPCRKEMPTLDRLQGRFAPTDVVVIALSIDRKGIDVVQPFFRSINVEHLKPYVDESGKAVRELGLVGLPATLLISQDGREIARLLGDFDWSSEEVLAFIQSRLGNNPRTRLEDQADEPGAGSSRP